MEFNEYLEQFSQLDDEFHDYEMKTKGKEWSLEQETLAYLTEAGAVGREVIANEGILPEEVYDEDTLGEKLAQNIWWLTVIAKHKRIDLNLELNKLLEGAVEK